MIDLWPEDIQTVRVKAPVTILKEQAAFLGQRTKNVVTAEVVLRQGVTTAFRFSFYIVGPAIGNYRYRLLTVSYSPPFYPLTLDPAPGILMELYPDTSQGEALVIINSRNEFLAVLRKVFSASKTLRVVRAILALSGVELDD